MLKRAFLSFTFHLSLCVLCLLAFLLPADAQTAPTPNTQHPIPSLVLQQGHSSRILTTAFALDKPLLATAGVDGIARLWDLKTNQLLLTLPHGAPITALGFSTNGQTLATLSAGMLRFWNTQTGQPLGTTATTATNAAAFTCNGSTASAYFNQGGMQVWDMQTGTLKNTYAWNSELHQKYGRLLAFLPDGKTLLFQREEQEDPDANNGAAPAKRYKLVTFELVDAETGKSKMMLQPFELRQEQGYSPTVAVAPDGSALALAGTDSSARLWNLHTGKLLPVLKGNRLPTAYVAFSPDSKRLATASAQVDKESPGDVFLWDVTTGKQAAILPGKAEVPVYALQFDQRGQTLAVAAPDWHTPKHGVQLWNVTTGKPFLETTGGGDSASLLFSPDNTLLVGSDAEGGITAWDRQTGRQTTAFSRANPLYYSAYSPDGTLAACVAYNGYMQIWDVTTGRLRDSFPTNPDYSPRDRYLQTDPVFTPDGQSVAFLLSHNGSVDLYDLKTRARRRLYKCENNSPAPANRIVFSPDGKTLAVSANDNRTRLIDTASGNLLTTLDYNFNNVSVGRDLAALFTPDGKTFLGLNNTNILLFDVPSGKLRRALTLGRFQDGIHLNADGSLLTTEQDREVHVYDVATGMLKTTLKVSDGEYIFSVMLSPNGRLVLTRGVQHLRLWNVATGQVVAVLDYTPQNNEPNYVYGYNPNALTFSADSARFCIRQPSGQAMIWDVQTGKRVPVATLESLAAFPPAFRRPLSIEGAALVVHDPRDGRPLVTMTAFPAVTPEEQQAGPDKPDNKTLAARPFEWLAQTPDGYYDGSADIGRYLRWNLNGVLFPADRYQKEFHRPDMLQKTLRLELPSSPTATKTADNKQIGNLNATVFTFEDGVKF